MPRERRWFDSHLDLAYLSLIGRDMIEGQADERGAITLPSLRESSVQRVLATVFTESQGEGTAGYPKGDYEAAAIAGKEQVAIYDSWRESGLMGPLGSGASLEAGILIESADPVRSPEDLEWWQEKGVVAIGLAWWRSSRYAGGNGTDEGLTAQGLDLIDAMDERGIIHDLSHLSQRATDELLARTSRPVIASHSNCRELMDGKDQRHLADSTIREIGQRGGVIGVNLYAPFLTTRPPEDPAQSPPAEISDVVAHIERIVDLMGHTRGVGLGSDADGVLGPNWLPRGIDSPRDYERIAQALSESGWSDEDLDGFCNGNWSSFWSLDQGDP